MCLPQYKCTHKNYRRHEAQNINAGQDRRQLDAKFNAMWSQQGLPTRTDLIKDLSDAVVHIEALIDIIPEELLTDEQKFRVCQEAGRFVNSFWQGQSREYRRVSRDTELVLGIASE